MRGGALQRITRSRSYLMPIAIPMLGLTRYYYYYYYCYYYYFYGSDSHAYIY